MQMNWVFLILAAFLFLMKLATLYAAYLCGKAAVVGVERGSYKAAAQLGLWSVFLMLLALV